MPGADRYKVLNGIHKITFLLSRSLLSSGYEAVDNNENIFVAVYADGRWSFPNNLEEDMAYIKTYSTLEALGIIMELAPDVMVQHIQCQMKYKYNAIFEILNIQYIGADSHVSANIVHKGTSMKWSSQPTHRQYNCVYRHHQRHP